MFFRILLPILLLGGLSVGFYIVYPSIMALLRKTNWYRLHEQRQAILFRKNKALLLQEDIRVREAELVARGQELELRKKELEADQKLLAQNQAELKALEAPKE